ncbi:MAG TPA: SAM-dependent methyltransferase, partial [Polyangiaceae bacterium]|nr:SAM-dependent methyltransferase [Polyangiaceae bacterium]
MSTTQASRQEIDDVSDTARWVAAYRAWETKRRDALFHDPYAARLAGEKGQRIARGMRGFNGSHNGWPIVTRTKILDDLILSAVQDGCTCVLNLAAGFDTRPYRLPLPADVRWFEADLPTILEEKEVELANEQPRCALHRIAVDLTDPIQRAALFDRVDQAGRSTLVITEGLVVYLEPSSVHELAVALFARANFTHWALDFSSPAILRDLQRSMGQALTRAPMKFAPADGLQFFETIGWRAQRVHSLFHEGARLRRVPWPLRLLSAFPPPPAHALGKNRWSGVVCLG